MARGANTATAHTSARVRITPDSKRLRERADKVSSALVKAGAEAVVLFGSAARGTAGENSDLDLFVVWEQELGIKKTLGKDYGDVGFSAAKWEHISDPGRRWSFFKSLASEAVYLHDPKQRLQKQFKQLPERPSKEAIEETVRNLQNSSKPFNHLDMYGGFYTFLYSDAYRWAKVAAVESNICSGIDVADRAGNFDAFVERHPEQADNVAWIQRVEPFYLRTMGKGEPKRPWSHKGTDAEAEKTIKASEEIIDTACKELLSKASNQK